LADKADAINARDVSRVLIGQPEGQPEIFVRVGRYGPFIEQGDRRASLPDKQAPDELSVSTALEMLDHATQAEEPLGTCPQTGKPVYLRIGRFGPYVQRGNTDDDEKPQNASLLKGMQPQDIDLATAIKLLSLPRQLGVHPQSGEPIVAHNGRFGPFVKCGAETRSLPAGISPLEVTLEEALAVLAQPKAGRGAARRKEPIKVFEASPVTGQPVQLLEGRYGPYVTDGQTNASIPRNMPPQEGTLPMALELLKVRAEKGPSAAAPRGRGARRAPVRKVAAKPAAKKSPAKKKAKRAAKKQA
jgi:DNA topoisomerase-1